MRACAAAAAPRPLPGAAPGRREGPGACRRRAQRNTCLGAPSRVSSNSAARRARAAGINGSWQGAGRRPPAAAACMVSRVNTGSLLIRAAHKVANRTQPKRAEAWRGPPRIVGFDETAPWGWISKSAACKGAPPAARGSAPAVGPRVAGGSHSRRAGGARSARHPRRRRQPGAGAPSGAAAAFGGLEGQGPVVSR
ncbi:MAG: hypothetical protein J3K34DRAFT_400887 [Monoraphidium minutum]|nr:MAG: hypothetical protein J3K34DRAFT_400887 [Monoraphidium minutum]